LSNLGEFGATEGTFRLEEDLKNYLNSPISRMKVRFLGLCYALAIRECIGGIVDGILGVLDVEASEGRESCFLKDRSTPSMIHNETLELVATLNFAPNKIAWLHKEGRMFFTTHPFMNKKGIPRLLEWDHSQSIGVPFPIDDWQDEIHALTDIVVDNGRRWLYALESDPFQGVPAFIYTIRLTLNDISSKFEIPNDVLRDGTLTSITIGPQGRYLFVTDSGARNGNAGLIVLDSFTWKCWRLLGDHATTAPQKLAPRLHNRDEIQLPFFAAGLSATAVNHKSKALYYGSMMGEMLYKVPVHPMVKSAPWTLKVEDFWKKYELPILNSVKMLGPKTAMEDMVVDSDKGYIYLTDFEHSAITLVDVSKEYFMMTFVGDETKLRWPTGIDIHQGFLYIACSAVDSILAEQTFTSINSPFKIFRVPLYNGKAFHNEL